MSCCKTSGRTCLSVAAFARTRVARTLASAATFCIVIANAALHAAEPVPLTRDGRLKFATTVCSNGREVVYCELANPALYRLMKLNLQNRTSQPLHPKAETSEFDPVFAADGKTYAFLKTIGVLQAAIVIHDDIGNKLGQVAPAGGFSGLRSPAIAPDRSRVVYSFGEGGRQHIFSAKLDGTERQALADTPGINNWPAFSPDGRSIVFGSSRDADFEIYRMNADGSAPQRLTNSPAQDIRPKFSPDGKRIAFTSHRDGNAEIYVMQADGSNPQRVTNSPERDDYADWLPDSEHLVIVREHDGWHDLFLVDVPPGR